MKFVPNTIGRSISRSMLTTKKNSPHIFFIGGLGLILGGAYLACRATLKLEETVDEIKSDLDTVKILRETPGVIKNGKPYTEQDYHKDLGYVVTKSTIKMAKLYGPAIIVGGAGITAVTGSHIQLTRRNGALTVTLAAVTNAFEKYRERVRKEVGEERELELHRAINDQKIEIDGKKQLVKVADPNGWSIYARWFDEASPNWIKDAEHNRIFLQAQQNYANNLLHARGHVFLNEVYHALGLEHSQAGAVVGWVLNSNGDNFVDFGLFEAVNSSLINNYEPRILLDFNVDGVIYDKIKE